MVDIADRASIHESGDRAFALTELEFRDGESDDTITFEGVASVVDKPYTVRDQFGEFTETIRSGAFNKTLKDSKADVALFVNHQRMAIPLATRSSGTLQLRATPDLAVSATLNARRHDVQDVREAVRDKVLPQMSIGMKVPKARDEWNDSYTERTIHELILGETSIVWQGANTLTSGSMRSLDELIAELPTDLTSDELRRAIAAFEARLEEVEPAGEDEGPTEEMVALFAEQIAMMQDVGAKVHA